MIAGHTTLATPADAARWLRARAPAAAAALRADSRRVHTLLVDPQKDLPLSPPPAADQ